MSEQFYTLITNIGKAKIANSNVLGTKLNLVKFQAGDSGGTYYNPTEDQIKLKNKVWEGNINSIKIDADNPNWIVIEVIIPSSQGGFTIREAAVVDDEDNLIAIGKYPETYKPVTADGSSKDLFIRMILEISNTQNVTLKVDPTVIIATKKDVELIESRVKNFENKVSMIETELKDSTLPSFKTDVQNTKLEGCVGGFVNIDSIQGQTLVNLSRWDNVVSDSVNKRYSTLTGDIFGERTLTLINLTNKTVQVSVNNITTGAFIKSIFAKEITTLIKVAAGEKINTIIGNVVDGWTDANKNDLLKVMILEGDWTNKPIPQWFEGIKSVGELILSSTNLINMSSEILKPLSSSNDDNLKSKIINGNLNIYSGSAQYHGWGYKIWLDVGKYNINFRNITSSIYPVVTIHQDNNFNLFIVKNATSMDIDIISGGWYYITFQISGVSSATNPLILSDIQLKKYDYRIEILSQSENLCPKFSTPFNMVVGTVVESELSQINKLPDELWFGIVDANGVLIDSPDYQYKINFYDKDKNFIDFWYSLGKLRKLTKSDIKNLYDRVKYISLSTSDLTKININVTGILILSKLDKTEILSSQPLRQWDSIDNNGVKTIGSAQIVLNGSENWDVHSGYSLQDYSVFFYQINNPYKYIGQYDNSFICDKFKNENWFSMYSTKTPEESISFGDNGYVYIKINKTKLATQDVTGFKTWLSQNPTTVVYQLETLVTENVNKTLDLRAHDNLVVNAGAIQPQVSYSYAKNTGERITSIEDTVENVKDKIDSLDDYEEVVLTPLNGMKNNGSGINRVIRRGNVCTIVINLDGTNADTTSFNIGYLKVPNNFIPKKPIDGTVIATSSGVSSLYLSESGYVTRGSYITPTKPTWMVGSITYVI